MRAALGEIHSPFPFQKVNQGVDGRGLERVATDQQRVETQGLPEMVILDVFCYGLVHRTIGSQPNQRRRDRHHVGEPKKRSVSQFGVSFSKHLLRIFEKTLIAFSIRLISLCNLGDHFRFVSNIIKSVAIAPYQPVHRLNFHEVDVIFQPTVGKFKQIGEGVGRGDDGRASVEREPIVFVNISSASRKVTGFIQHRLDACRLQAYGCSKSSEAASNHSGRFVLI